MAGELEFSDGPLGPVKLIELVEIIGLPRAACMICKEGLGGSVNGLAGFLVEELNGVRGVICGECSLKFVNWDV